MSLELGITDWIENDSSPILEVGSGKKKRRPFGLHIHATNKLTNSLNRIYGQAFFGLKPSKNISGQYAKTYWQKLLQEWWKMLYFSQYKHQFALQVQIPCSSNQVDCWCKKKHYKSPCVFLCVCISVLPKKSLCVYTNNSKIASAPGFMPRQGFPKANVADIRPTGTPTVRPSVQQPVPEPLHFTAAKCQQSNQ